MKRSLVALVVPAAFAIACGSGEPEPAAGPHVPTLAELAPVDASVDIVDRAAELSGAADAADASAGPALDLTAAGAGFRMEVSSEEEVGSLEGEIPRAATYNAVLAAVQRAAAADLVATVVVGVPAAAVAVTANGAVVEVGPNVWVATNAVSDGLTTVQGTLVVAWVDVGWLAEMRITSSDGRYNDTKWFNGFVSADGNVGWWDIYDTYGTVAGVVEWTDDGAGNAQFGIAALTGDNAGDVLWYGFTGGEALVTYHDASSAQDTWVYVAPDKSGEVRAPDFNAGVVACWDAEAAEVPYADVTCPAE